MGSESKIEWTDHTWNPWVGCHKVSAGCKHCYMYREQLRYGKRPDRVVRTSVATWRQPLVKRRDGSWKWASGSKVFVCSWSDFFHEDADRWRAEAWDVMARRPDLTFIVLTKRSELMGCRVPAEPRPNVWLGVSVENQEAADERIPLLLRTPAAVRFLSCEPLLGAVNVFRAEYSTGDAGPKGTLGWVICGGESGPGARPMHPEWARGLRDQCVTAGVPFFFKQWGEWLPIDQFGNEDCEPQHDHEAPKLHLWPGSSFPGSGPTGDAVCLGKKRAGRLLDGREWSEFPIAATSARVDRCR